MVASNYESIPSDNLVLTNATDLKTTPKLVNSNLCRRVWLFVLERKWAIIFRILGFVALYFDIYSIAKKCRRGHYGWAVSSVLLLILTRIIGSFYSLYCEVIEQRSLSREEETVEMLHREVEGGFAGDEHLEQLSESDDGQDLETDDVHDPELHTSHQSADISKSDGIEENAEMKKQSSKKSGITFLPTVIRKSLKRKKLESQLSTPSYHGSLYHGSYIEPRFKRQQDLPWKEFFAGVQHCKLSMKLSHFFPIPFPQEYQFCRTSHILWTHYAELYCKDACKMIKKAGVQEACFRPFLLKYTQRKIISKEISLIMATVQTIPMILIELLYWTVLSAKIFEGSKFSFFDLSSYGGNKFNIFELASLVINIVNISYRLVSLTGQMRKLNVLKQNMKMVHKAYLTMIYSFLLLSRILSIYLVMCLNGNGTFFALFVLVNQFVIVCVISFNFTENEESDNPVAEDNILSTLLSNLFMVFLYLPPEKGKRMSMLGYYFIMCFEMVAMFSFGCFQLKTDDNLAAKITIVGHELAASHFYMIYGGTFVIFIGCWILGSEQVSKCMFLYKKELTWEYIQNEINNANSKYFTSYKIEVIIMTGHSIIIKSV